MNALCANPDCGAFFDRPGIPHIDRDTKKVVLLCENCSLYVENVRDPKWERLALPPKL